MLALSKEQHSWGVAVSSGHVPPSMKSFSEILSGHGTFEEKMLDILDCTFRQTVRLGVIGGRGFVLNAFLRAKVREVGAELGPVVRADDRRHSEVAKPSFKLVEDRGG